MACLHLIRLAVSCQKTIWIVGECLRIGSINHIFRSRVNPCVSTEVSTIKGYVETECCDVFSSAAKAALLTTYPIDVANIEIKKPGINLCIVVFPNSETAQLESFYDFAFLALRNSVFRYCLG